MEELIEPIVEFVKVLADSTRLRIIELLRDSERSAYDLQTILKKSQSTISQQLKILNTANIITFRKEKKTFLNEQGQSFSRIVKMYSIRNPQIFTVLATINSFLSDLNKEKIEDISSKDILDVLH
ncbi:MAG: ArsR/SmtB family transcription factor [Candidatus Helarchaeota archaeon]